MKMKAAIFVEPGRIVLDEKADPRCRPARRADAHHHHHDLRHRRAHPQGRVPGRQGPDHRPRAGRRDRKARHARCRATPRASASSPARSRPSGHSDACLCGCPRQDGRRHRSIGWPRRSAAGRSATPSTAARPSTCWCPDAHGQPGAGAGRPDRRAGADVPGHHVHRLHAAPRAAASASATRWRCSRRGRSACAPRPAPG